MKAPYTVRLDPVLLKEIQKLAEERDSTVVSIFEIALKSFLSAPNPEEPGLLARIERLEKEVLQKLKKPDSYTEAFKEMREAKKKPTIRNSRTVQKDSITIKEAADLTGYSASTLSSKFARAGVKAVDRIDGNRAGLYNKEEVMRKIGNK